MGINMRRPAAPSPNVSPLAGEADRFAPVAQSAAKEPIATERPAMSATVEPATTVATPIRDNAPEHSSSAARAAKWASSVDQVLASEPMVGAAKLSVMPDPGGRSDLIAAARRTAQAASGASAVIQTAVLVPARGIARLHVLIGATAAILIVLGLLQIARVLVSPSAETALVTPSNVAPDIVPIDRPELASSGDPTLAGFAANPLRPGSILDWEVTGKVPLSTGTAAATAASAAAVKSAPAALGTNLDLAMPRHAQ